MRNLALIMLAAAPGALAAQVGHTPATSPYRDVSTTMRLTAITGWYRGASDPAGVMPKSGPMLGVRWYAHVGGPAEIGVRFAMVSTDRTVIDPTRAAQDRVVETRDVRLGFGDVALVFNLTGNKSWNRLVPFVHTGIGLTSDFAGRDVGGFRHGTEFAFAYGGGLRYVPSDRFEFRAELGSHFYNVEYPSSYLQPGADETSVLPPTAARDGWRNNWSIAFGVSIAPFR